MDRKPDILLRFGHRVRELQKAKGLSQESFAEHCGLNRSYMGGIERGERNVALKNVEIIAKALALTVSEIMQGVESEDDNG